MSKLHTAKRVLRLVIANRIVVTLGLLLLAVIISVTWSGHSKLRHDVPQSSADNAQGKYFSPQDPYFSSVVSQVNNYYAAHAALLNMQGDFKSSDITETCSKLYSDNPYGDQAPNAAAKNDLMCGAGNNGRDFTLSSPLTMAQAANLIQKLATLADQEGFKAQAANTNIGKAYYTSLPTGGYRNSCSLTALYKNDDAGDITDLNYSIFCGVVTKQVPPGYTLQYSM